MCQWWCTSSGPSTNLQCLHCKIRYCAACLHGEAGKMESLIKCAKCGKKPRVLDAKDKAAGVKEAVTVGGYSPSAALKMQSKSASVSASSSPKKSSSLSSSSASSKTATPSASPKKKKSTGPSIFDKLTDTSLYTGSHKLRFDADGKGKGLQGRDAASGVEYGGSKVNDISQILRPNVRNEKATAPLAAFQVSTSTSGSGSNSPARSKSPQKEKPKESSDAKDSSEVSSSPTPSDSKEKEKSEKSADSPKKKSPKKATSGKPSIFDKLTDTSLYTGAHKLRFDSQGRGKGMAGRDGASGQEYGGGNVHSLSAIMRPNIK